MMKRFSKIIIFILVFIIVLSLNACKSKDIGMFSELITDGDFTEDEIKSLSSFRKIHDYPVYIMNYQHSMIREKSF